LQFGKESETSIRVEGCRYFFFIQIILKYLEIFINNPVISDMNPAGYDYWPVNYKVKKSASLDYFLFVPGSLFLFLRNQLKYLFFNF
jgi:hypothetical protein